MGANNIQKLIVGISSRTLFDLDQSNHIFENKGVEQYAQYQIEHENEILQAGAAFPLVQKFLNLNKEQELVEVILISRNSADTGLRVFNSIKHHHLNISRAAFTSGKSPYPYIQAFGMHLFLSSNRQDVENALSAGCAAATVLSPTTLLDETPELRIAFDGDAVIFSDEAERIFQEQGLEAFTNNEVVSANKPLSGGPFKGFLNALYTLQRSFPENNCPIRTALITARQAPAHERVIRTLRSWNIRIDEAIFLGGLDKSQFLKAFRADIFFDDQQRHCESTKEFVTTGHVPNGIVNSK